MCAPAIHLFACWELNAVNLVNWNIERNKPSSWKAKSLVEEIASLTPDIICLTEAWAQSLESLVGFSIGACGAKWSPQHRDERKVLLWSKRPWQAVEVIAELEEIGSAITGKTHLGGALVRIVGICIPYHFANPYGSEPRAKPWSLHEVFLEKLSPLLATWRSEGDVIVLGDFNRRIPRAWGPKHAYNLLEAAFQGYEFATQGLLQGVGDQTIDHAALAGNFITTSVSGRTARAPDGRLRSDHFGVFVRLKHSTGYEA